MATLPMPPTIRATKIYKQRKTTSPRDFRSLYRFEEANLEWIARHFLGENNETRGGALTTKQQMQIFLRYLSDPGFQTGVAEDVGVDQTTVCKTIHKVKNNILEKRNVWIKFPETPLEIMVAKNEWQERFSIPTIIGAIDCTHVRITKPSVGGDEYINRKRFPSINVQATCNAHERFTSVTAEYPGSVHDSRIFKNSEVFRFLKTMTQDTALLGDSGYGIAPWLLTPFNNPDSEVKRHFNRIYAKERVIIERCFGQVKRRFPILHYKIRVATLNIPGIIICCFILHNVAKYLHDADDFEELPENDAMERNPGAEPTDARIRARGQQIRQRIAETMFINRVI